MTPPKPIVLLVLLAFFVSIVPVKARAEAMADSYSSISPNLGGSGEFVHGQKQGKILVRVLMFGSVPQQGIHFVPEGTDLLFAILYAGGYGDNSKLNGITIRRRNVKALLEVDLEDLVEEGREIPRLYDGDIVTVPFNWRRDISTITLVTGFISSMTAFTLALIALTRPTTAH